jgi:hypothetical protein
MHIVLILTHAVLLFFSTAHSPNLCLDAHTDAKKLQGIRQILIANAPADADTCFGLDDYPGALVVGGSARVQDVAVLTALCANSDLHMSQVLHNVAQTACFTSTRVDEGWLQLDLLYMGWSEAVPAETERTMCSTSGIL